jgi:hypothetical protein
MRIHTTHITSGVIMDETNDPVFFKAECWRQGFPGDPELSPGWYFWDETWSHPHGPFNTEEEARRAMDDYADSL